MTTEPPEAPQRDDKPPRLLCPQCPEWPGTNSPNLWGDHVRALHDGISPRTGRRITKRHRVIPKEPSPIHPVVHLAESYEAVIQSLNEMRQYIDVTITTLRRSRRYILFSRKVYR